MKVSDAMSKAYTIDKSGRFSEALDMMDKHHVRRLVVRHKDDVQGIVTLRGICGELGSRRKYNHPPSLFHVCDALSESYGIVEPDDDLKKAIDMLKELDTVIVVDGGIRGVITTKDILRHITPDGTAASIMKMPLVAPPDARVSFIRKLMMDRSVSRVPILEGATLIGMVSETDIAKALRGLKSRTPGNQQSTKMESLIASDIMSVDVIVIKPDTTLKEAAGIMLDKDVGALPVLNDMKHLVGLVTRRDMIRAI